MRKNGRMASIGAIVATVALLAACTTSAVTETPVTPEASAEVSTILTAEDSPILAYVRVATAEENQHLLRKQEELTIACMAEHGFTIPASETQPSVTGTGLDLDINSREFAETYGYGVFNNPFSAGPLGVLTSQGAPEAPTSAIDEFYESLDVADQQAFSEAFDGAPEEGGRGVGGCFGDARAAVFDTNPWDAEAFRTLINTMKSIYRDTQNDHRTAELNQQWVACMADAGFGGLKTHANAHEEFTQQLFELQRAFEAENPPVRGQELPTFEFTGPEIDAGLERERAQAVADWDCRDSLHYESEMLRTKFKYEQQYIEEHEAELIAFRDAFDAWVQQ